MWSGDLKLRWHATYQAARKLRSYLYQANTQIPNYLYQFTIQTRIIPNHHHSEIAYNERPFFSMTFFFILKAI